jgi:hypothetical protein
MLQLVKRSANSSSELNSCRDRVGSGFRKLPYLVFWCLFLLSLRSTRDNGVMLKGVMECADVKSQCQAHDPSGHGVTFRFAALNTAAIQVADANG